MTVKKGSGKIESRRKENRVYENVDRMKDGKEWIWNE